MSTESSLFKVALRDVPVHRRIVVPAAYVAELVRGMPLRDALDEIPDGDGGVAELDLDTDGDSVFVQGHITGQVAVACSRCVAAVPVRFDEQVRVTFLPHAQVAPEDDPDAGHGRDAARDAAHGKDAHGKDGGAKDKHADEDDGVELAEDDLDVFPYSGDVIDLEPLVREQFVLAVPYAPLCKEDCLGLCDQCGADKNVAPCTCARPIDPRFAALQGLKLPS